MIETTIDSPMMGKIVSEAIGEICIFYLRLCITMPNDPLYEAEYNKKILNKRWKRLLKSCE